MTEREVYEATLIELNKVQAPSLLLEDFNYIINKAIQRYINKKYNLFEINQQLTDDLRVLVSSKNIEVNMSNGTNPGDPFNNNIFGTSYTCNLPEDYLHILNCVCEFIDSKPTGRCEKNCNKYIYGAHKLTTNQWSSVITNHYMKPSYRQPYFYIINISDPSYVENLPKDKKSETRYGNSIIPKMEIKCGNNSRYKLNKVYIDYLRAPKYIKLNQEELDELEDNTSILEFPDYVIYEIINEIVLLILENQKDQRVQTFPAISQTIPDK